MIPAPGEVSEEGTFINKATLLTDAVAGMFGFGASAVPNDMFNVLTHAGDLHVWKRTQDGVVDYPVSPDRNAYQEGTVDDTTVEYMGQLGNKVQIETGSYVGTGKYGSSNPNSLTFGFVPKLVFIMCIDSAPNSNNNNTEYCVLLPTVSSLAYGIPGDIGTALSVSLNENTVSWFFSGTNNTIQDIYQKNDGGVTYGYISLG